MKWQRLAIVLMGVFLIPLDFNIVNVSAPLIKMGLGASSAHIQLIIGWALVAAYFFNQCSNSDDYYSVFAKIPCR